MNQKQQSPANLEIAELFDEVDYSQSQVALKLLKPFNITSLDDRTTIISREKLLSKEVSDHYCCLFPLIRTVYKKNEIRSVKADQWYKDKKRTQNLLRQVLKSIGLKLAHSKKYVGIRQGKRQYVYQYKLEAIKKSDLPFDI